MPLTCFHFWKLHFIFSKYDNFIAILGSKNRNNKEIEIHVISSFITSLVLSIAVDFGIMIWGLMSTSQALKTLGRQY